MHEEIGERVSWRKNGSDSPRIITCSDLSLEPIDSITQRNGYDGLNKVEFSWGMGVFLVFSTTAQDRYKDRRFQTDQDQTTL